MISIIKGFVLQNSGTEIIVMTSSGVGYNIFVSPARSDVWKVGAEAEILTCHIVREDSQELFGFGNETERELFNKLLSVSGIGPKSALRLMSLGTVEEIGAAINRGDLVYLTKVSGIGSKTAERIVVELRGKIGKNVEIIEGGDVLGDVVEGLMALGYSASEARAVVKPLNSAGKTSEQLLKEALQKMK